MYILTDLKKIFSKSIIVCIYNTKQFVGLIFFINTFDFNLIYFLCILYVNYLDNVTASNLYIISYMSLTLIDKSIYNNEKKNID